MSVPPKRRHDDDATDRAAEDRPRFPNARVLLGRADWEENPARSHPASPLAQQVDAVARAGLSELVDDEREVVPGLTMAPTPGESPGHMAVRVRAGGATFLFVGDLFHHPCQVEHPDWVLDGRDATATRRVGALGYSRRAARTRRPRSTGSPANVAAERGRGHARATLRPR